MSSILETCGYLWEVAEDGAEALKKFSVNTYDLILMDIEMPVMDGITATKNIRIYEAEKNLSPTPIIGITAYSQLEDRKKCIDAGMTDYLCKPFNPEELREKMLEPLKKR